MEGILLGTLVEARIGSYANAGAKKGPAVFLASLAEKRNRHTNEDESTYLGLLTALRTFRTT
jgi:hypothetical protein